VAIGTMAAIGLGVGALGAGASAISANKASKRAAQTSQANTDANVALARDIYGQNQQALNPFMQRGNVAGNQINALLGLGGSQNMGGPANVGALPGAQPNALSQFQGQYAGNAGAPYGLGEGFPGVRPQNALGNMGVMGGAMPTAGVTGAPTTLPAGTVNTTVTPQQAAQSAFDIFKGSTNYQNRLNSAMDAVSSLYSGIGGLQSGAAIRGAQRNASNLASEELMNYFALLGGQQATGAGAASSLAGVGQNFAGTVIGANNFNAANQMNAQLGQQNALANFAGILGGGLFSMGAR